MTYCIIHVAFLAQDWYPHVAHTRSPMATRDSKDYCRQRTYLHKVRLCENLPKFRKCQYGDNCMYAHTLKDLQVPDEGKDGEFPWNKVWQDKLVHRWYGQPEMPNGFKDLLRVYVAHHLHHQREVPEWAIGANAWFNGMAPPWPPKHWDFNLAYDIEQLRIKRGGKLPPGVRPLSAHMKNQLRDLANRPKGKGKGGPGAAAFFDPNAGLLGGDFDANLASSEVPEVPPNAVPSTAALPPTASAPAAPPKAAEP